MSTWCRISPSSWLVLVVLPYLHFTTAQGNDCNQKWALKKLAINPPADQMLLYTTISIDHNVPQPKYLGSDCTHAGLGDYSIMKARCKADKIIQWRLGPIWSCFRLLQFWPHWLRQARLHSFVVRFPRDILLNIWVPYFVKRYTIYRRFSLFIIKQT